MQIPVVSGIIDRRILANYRIGPEVISRILPAPFQPKLVNGFAIGGICLIRLKAVRPRFLPIPWGLRSENAAHRIAVQWESGGELHEGVYIPRRDSDSRMSALAGGRIFPGIHHNARFTVAESGGRYSVQIDSDDGVTKMAIAGRVADQMPASSTFDSVLAASEFFERGSLGYSDMRNGDFDGLELRCNDWHVNAFAVNGIESSFFDDRSVFPAGSIEFDSALLMRGIRHEWHGRGRMCCNGILGE